MGKGRKPGVLSAARKISEIRSLVEEYNKPLSAIIGKMDMHHALLELHMAYHMDHEIAPPQNLNEACRRMLERMKQIHRTEIAESATAAVAYVPNYRFQK